MKQERTKSKALYERAVSMIPGGVNSPVRAFKQVGGTPVYFKEASGSSCVDVDGNKYVDFCQSWGPLMLGHAHPEVIDAVKQAADSGLSFGACHEKEIELASLVLEAFPEFSKVRLVNSGTEAVMTALRLCRGFTERNLIIKFEGCYHGHFDGMLVKAGSGLATTGIASSKGIPDEISQTTLVARLDDEESVLQLFEKYGDRIAGVIIEPLPANNGLLIQRTNFLRFIRKITREYGALLIFDEVISGFRLHFGGYFQMIRVRPDLITLGKVIGGGMPVGAIAGKEEIMDCLSPIGEVYQAGTLSGNPVSLAAGIATLKILKAENPYERVANLGKALRRRLMQAGQSWIKAIQIGSIAWLYLDEGSFPESADKISPRAMARFTKIYSGLLDAGYYLPPSSYEVLFLSTAHTKEEIEGLADTVVKLSLEAYQ